MFRRICIVGGILAALFALPSCSAQVIELACPTGTTSLQALQTTDTTNGQIRQNYCIDKFGVVTENIGTSILTTKISLTGTGLFNNTEEDFGSSLINGITPQSEMHTLFSPTANAINGFAGGVSVPSTSTTGQAMGISGWAIDNRANPTTPTVAVFGSGRAIGQNARTWGANFVGSDQGSSLGTTSLFGDENDCFVSLTGTLCTGTLSEAFWLGGIQPTIAIAFRAGQPQGTVANPHWTMGYRCDTGATITPDGNNACLYMFQAATGVSQNSQGITFLSTRSDGATPVGTMFQTPPGELNFTQSAGGHGLTLFTAGMPLTFTEGGAPSTAAVGVDSCYGDSTAHAIKCSYNNGAEGFLNLPRIIASGTAVMTTAAIAAGACGTTVTVAAANVLTTDTITVAFNAAPAGTNAGLTQWPTAGNVNFAYCPGVAETPAAATINWKVIR